MAERFFEVQNELAQVKDGTALFHLDEEVDVAVRDCLASGDRSEEANVAGTASSGDPEDLLAAGAECLNGRGGSICDGHGRCKE